MKILISNDDGYQAPGLVALYEVLKEVAEVEVIAPVLDDAHRGQFLDILNTEWTDRRGSWELCLDGEYEKLPGDESAQELFASARHPV